MLLFLQQIDTAAVDPQTAFWTAIIGVTFVGLGQLLNLWLSWQAKKQNELIVAQNVAHERNAHERAVLRGDQPQPVTTKAPFPGDREG